MLVKFIVEKKDSWEDYLDTCVFAYNTSVHESSRFTPYELMFGRKPVLPIDLQMEKSVDNDYLECLDQDQAGIHVLQIRCTLHLCSLHRRSKS